MLKLIAQRLGLGVLTLFAASVLIFIGTELLPGDLASAILDNLVLHQGLVVGDDDADRHEAACSVGMRARTRNPEAVGSATSLPP